MSKLGTPLEDCEPPENRNRNEILSERGFIEKSYKILDLPDEIILLIFAYFDVVFLSIIVAPVCRKWRSLAHDPVLWQSLKFIDFDPKKEECMLRVIEKSPYASSLFIESSVMSDRALEVIAESLKNLRKLTMRFCQISDEGALGAVAARCPNLQDVNVEGSRFANPCSYGSFAQMPCLVHLNLSHCNLHDNNIIVAIASKCSLLESFNIDGITSIYDSPVRELIKERFKVLKNLILDGECLTDASFEKLDACENLEKLCISFCEEMTDRSISKIARLSSLKELKLRKGLRLTAEALASLFSNGALCNLNYLNLGECPLVNDATLKSIGKNCPLLQSLGLQWCWEVTDEGMEHIVHGCTKLRILDLVGIVRMTGAFLVKLEAMLPDLRVLDLEQCSNIEDSNLVKLNHMRPELKIFDYWGDTIEPDS